jgi:hypothetical protein
VCKPFFLIFVFENIPPYGWVVSGAYFLGKYGMEELNIDFWNK